MTFSSKAVILLAICLLSTTASATLVTAVEESENVLIKAIQYDEATKTKEVISLAAHEYLNFMTLLSAATMKHKSKTNLRFRSLITNGNGDEDAKYLNGAMVHSADYFRTALDSTHDIENILMIEQLKATSSHQRALRLHAIQQSEHMTAHDKDESVLTELVQKAEEAFERSKTLHSDAAAKLYYEKNRCQLTTLPFICKYLDAYQKRLSSAEELRKAAQMLFNEQKKEVQLARDLTINLQIRLEISTNKYHAAAVLKEIDDLAIQAKPLRDLVTEFDQLLHEPTYNDVDMQTGKGTLIRMTALVREVVKNFLGTESESWRSIEKLYNDEVSGTN